MEGVGVRVTSGGGGCQVRRERGLLSGDLRLVSCGGGGGRGGRRVEGGREVRMRHGHGRRRLEVCHAAGGRGGRGMGPRNAATEAAAGRRADAVTKSLLEKRNNNEFVFSPLFHRRKIRNPSNFRNLFQFSHRKGEAQRAEKPTVILLRPRAVYISHTVVYQADRRNAVIAKTH